MLLLIDDDCAVVAAKEVMMLLLQQQQRRWVKRSNRGSYAEQVSKKSKSMTEDGGEREEQICDR